MAGFGEQKKKKRSTPQHKTYIRGEVLHQKAVDHHMRGDLVNAEKAYRSAIKTGYQNSATFLNLGLICKNSGQTKEAVLLYEKAIELFDNNTETEIGFIDKTKRLHSKATKDQFDKKFNFISEDVYSVPDDIKQFPALTSLNINQGISAVKYSINPSALTSFKVSEPIEKLIK